MEQDHFFRRDEPLTSTTGGAPGLVAALDRDNVILAGNVGGYFEITDLIARALTSRRYVV